MKIDETLNSRPKVYGNLTSDYKKVTGNNVKSFESRLIQAEYDNYSEKLNDLAERIFEQGKKLEKRMDIREYIVYKRYISEFLNEYVNNTFKFSKQRMMDRRGRYRTYSVIKKINYELDELANELLKDQKDNFKILKRLDCIRGLILDMLL
ncbi:MAG TPA: YaaR family protein [Clostridiaceae bacterium]|nr:YaaR family protein [Clostridiaceae bacterium]